MAPKDKLAAFIEADPEAAAQLLLELQTKVIIPHEGGQKEIMENDARFQIVCCGRRFGKTVIGAKKALTVCKKPKKLAWWIAPTYKVVKRGYAEVLRQLPDGLLTHSPPMESAFDAGRSVILRFKNGSKLEFYSAERPEAMLGAGVDYAVLDEAATMPKGVWETIVRPTLMDKEGGGLMISTPRGRNWYYYLWLRGQEDEHAAYKSWKFPTSANPYIPPEEIEEMKESMPLLVYEQEVLAEFISSAGAVFRFHPDIVVKTKKPQGRVIVGVDLARSHDFTVFSAARMNDCEPCGYDRFTDVAWALQKTRLYNFVKRLEKEGAEHVTLLIDSTGVGDPIAEEVEMAGYDVVPINFTKHKQNMVTQLGKDLELGTVRLDEKEQIHEFENYTYTITPGGKWTYGAPEGQHDDCVSAKMLQQWGIVQEGAPNVEPVTALSDEEMEKLEEAAQDEDSEVDDYSYLFDEPVGDEGVPVFTDAEPASTMELMNREECWTGMGEATAI